ncbi:hypothetical protein Bca4012_025851 [Brassica carinata]
MIPQIRNKLSLEERRWNKDVTMSALLNKSIFIPLHENTLRENEGTMDSHL